MAYDPDIAERIRAAIGNTVVIEEKKMFGGLAFLVDGNIAASAYKDGGMMIRCSSEDWPAFSAEPGTRPMLRKGRAVSGWVLIDAVSDETALRLWVERGLAFAASQPAK